MAELASDMGVWRRLLAPRIAHRIMSERTTPIRTGLAVGIGVLIGTSPFFGFHLAICLVVATLLGLNRAITYIAANISLPWIAPFLVFASIQTGNLMLHGALLPLDMQTITGFDPRRFGLTWLVGSAVVGVLLGLPAGLVAFAFTKAYRRRHPLQPDAALQVFDRAAAAYAGGSRFTEGYVRGKLKADPVFRQLVERAPLPSPIIDVGCGRGQTLILLALLQPDIEALGLDWDAAKLSAARRAAAPWPALRFLSADIRTAEIPAAGAILLLDVLHYSPRSTQDAMLRRAAQALRPDGVLYVREIDATRSWRATINTWQERLGCAVHLNRGATLCFRPAAELCAVLEAEGLTVRVGPSSGALPLANVLIEARRSPATIATAT